VRIFLDDDARVLVDLKGVMKGSSITGPVAKDCVRVTFLSVLIQNRHNVLARTLLLVSVLCLTRSSQSTGDPALFWLAEPSVYSQYLVGLLSSDGRWNTFPCFIAINAALARHITATTLPFLVSRIDNIVELSVTPWYTANWFQAIRRCTELSV